jgi:tetratricopeptide (TPR) repeat protein
MAAFFHGALSLQLGDPEAAVPSLQRAVAQNPTEWRASTNLAAALLNLGRTVEAAPIARRVVRAQPRLIAGHLLLSQAFHAAGDLQGALAAAREALRLDRAREAQPAGASYESPLCAVGEILVEMRELEEAWSLAIEAAEAAGNTGVEMARACTLAGRVQEAAGQYEKALDAYAKATILDPRKPRANQLRVAMVTRSLRTGLPARRGDVFICTFPKSGTTWMQQVACMLCGEAANVDIQMRSPYIEAAVATSAFSLESLRRMAAPRIFKTHAAWPELPVAGCTATSPPPEARVLLVVRDPRDVMVSLYYHSRSIKGIAWQGSWDEWFDAFLEGKAPVPMTASASADDGGADWFAHTTTWWGVARANPQQVLWVRYEDLLAEPLEQVRRVAALIAPEHVENEALLESIVQASSFGEMKSRHEASHGDDMRIAGEAGHFRKGKAGDWRSHLSVAQRERFRAAMAQRLAGSGLEGAFLDE